MRPPARRPDVPPERNKPPAGKERKTGGGNGNWEIKKKGSEGKGGRMEGGEVS